MIETAILLIINKNNINYLLETIVNTFKIHLMVLMSVPLLIPSKLNS